MKKTERKRIVKDLAARLWVKGTKVYLPGRGETVELDASLWDKFRKREIDEVKPILKSVSRLTDNQMDAIFALVIPEGEDGSNDWIKFRQNGDIEFIFNRRSWTDVKKMYDYLIQEGYDIGGLIRDGLAIEEENDN